MRHSACRPVRGHRLPTLVCALTVALSPLVAQGPAALDPTVTKALPEGLYAFVSTRAGLVVLSLDWQKAPATVGNFAGLASGTLVAAGGRPFYDGLTFHRVIKDFMIQGGDPQGNGTGGPGYRFPDEIDPGQTFDRSGVLAMANSGPDTNGSQFFITHKDTPWLNGKHTIFGRVVLGQDVVDTVVQGDVITSIRIYAKGLAASSFALDQASQDARVAAILTARAQTVAQWPQVQADYLKPLLAAATLTQEGYWYRVLKAPSGSVAPEGSTIAVRMVGRLTNGSTIQFAPNNQAFSLVLGNPALPQGFNLALAAMGAGEQRLVYLPPELAFGDEGYGTLVPPRSWLILDITRY